MKKCFCLLLCAAILLGAIPLASAAYRNISDWAVEDVTAMDTLGLLPDDLKNADMKSMITRTQMTHMAVLVYNQLMAMPGYGFGSYNYFSDTNDKIISYAKEVGIVDGVGDGKFMPNAPLIRQDFFKLTYNLMCTAYWSPDGIELQPLNFTDAGSISEYALIPAQTMVSIGVVKGAGDVLLPRSNTTCEQAIVMFYRAYDYMSQWISSRNEDNKVVQIANEGYTGISPWAIMEISDMMNKNLIPSCLDRANMSSTITRAQMCSVAVTAANKIHGEPYVATGKNHFTDTTNPDVNLAYELGIVGGYGNGKFGPDDPLTREQFFKIMANFMKLWNYPREDVLSVSLGKFTDGNKVASWAQAPSRLMIYIGAVRGDGNTLRPQSHTSIQEALAVFLRTYKYTVSWREKYPNGEVIQPSIRDDLVAFACSFEGYPYVYGGNGPNSFDCSGFVLYVYRHFGYSFSRGAQEQYKDGTPVTYQELVPGDLVFFSSYSNIDYSNFRNITHVGLYIGNGKFIHASTPSTGVIISDITSNYYRNHFWGACRILKNDD